MITFKQLLEFKLSPKSSNKRRNEYALYDWNDKQVYTEAGTFTTPHLAFMKLNSLYNKDSDAYGDLGVIKYEGDKVFSITQKNGKFFKREIK